MAKTTTKAASKGKAKTDKTTADEAADLKTAQTAFDEKNSPAPRLPNPFLKSEDRDTNEKVEADRLEADKEPMDKADVIRLWAGGEHQKAMDLYHTLDLSDAEQEEVKEACPTWDELATQYGGPKPVGQNGPTPPDEEPKTKR